MLDEAASTALILRQYRALRSAFGLNRIQLGAHLHLIKEHKLWKGISDGWEAFLASENINPNAARQYINVAKKFVYEMDLDEETLSKLAGAGISALEKACKGINKDNQEEILGALISLSERDAIQRIIEISSAVEDQKSDAPTLRVLKVLREYHDLPPDLQNEFRSRLHGAEAVRHQRNRISEVDSKEEPDALPKGSAPRSMGFRRHSRSG